MAQYINKAAVVAEIEKIREQVKRLRYAIDANCIVTVRNVCECLELSIDLLANNIDTLEVKEVDLDNEIQNKIYNHFFDIDGIAIAGTSTYATVDDMAYIAKHFFELGLKAQKGE